MIGRLRGTLVGKRLDGVIVDVAGVGYELAVTSRDLAELPGVGEEIVLHTHLHVREDAMVLFGFSTERGRDFFRIVLTAPGVGPKVALAMLSTLDADELHAAIVGEDVDALTVVPGIGKRSAQKIVLELKPKLGDLPVGSSVGGGSARPQVREALEGLGYTSAEIRDTVAEIDGSLPLAEQIRVALQLLGTGRAL